MSCCHKTSLHGSCTKLLARHWTHGRGSVSRSYDINLERERPSAEEGSGQLGGAASCLESVPVQLCDSGKATVFQVSPSVTQAQINSSTSLKVVRIRRENVLELRWKPSPGGSEKGAAAGGVVPWLGLGGEPVDPELPTG